MFHAIYILPEYIQARNSNINWGNCAVTSPLNGLINKLFARRCVRTVLCLNINCNSSIFSQGNPRFAIAIFSWKVHAGTPIKKYSYLSILVVQNKLLLYEYWMKCKVIPLFVTKNKPPFTPFRKKSCEESYLNSPPYQEIDIDYRPKIET